MDDPSYDKSARFYAGWHSHQMALMLKIYVNNSRQAFVNQYLSSLRPEIVSIIIADAEDLFSPRVAGLVQQFKEEWDGSQ